MEFSLLDYNNPQNVIFEYRISGSDWIQNAEGQNTVQLSHLQPGTYDIEVRALSEGVYSNTKVFTVRVTPPWYRSTLAYLLYFLVLATALVLAALYWRRRANQQLNEEKIKFPAGKSWKDYVADMRLEITCGEAPYLANRYDAVTGEFNRVAKYRIGMLDRKLRIVSENTKDSKEWILWAKVALRSTYGFEWQGDNLLLAREALFFTFAEHYIEQFGERKFNQNKMRMMPGVAYIISWNIWQMDGLKFGLPGYEPYIEEKTEEDPNQMSLFDDSDFYVEPKKKHVIKPHERLCLIKDFLDGVNLKKATLSKQDFHDLKAPKQTFESLVNKNN
jgi:hypothetical protein